MESEELIALLNQHLSKKDYKEVLQLAYKSPEDNRTTDIIHFIVISLVGLGDYKSALAIIEDRDDYKNIEEDTVNQVMYRSKRIELAIEEVKLGNHDNEVVNELRENIEQLIANKLFREAMVLLKKLTEARKIRTTNIVWIGKLLNDIYFDADFIEHRNTFDRTLLSEIVYYYLKACKIFDPNYQEIQKALKDVKND